MTTDLLGLAEKDLRSVLADAGDDRPYRARQVRQWLYRKDASSVDVMSDLPESLRGALAERARIDRFRVLRHQRASDGTQKFLFGLADGQSIETVVLRHPGRYTGCISTQVGCGMGCEFCATALLGLKRNLTAGEIVEQVMAAQRHAGVKLTNLVFMGMGEPLANYEALLRATEILHAPWGLEMGPRQLTVSTVGLVPAIRRLTEDKPPFNLAVSLHATTDEVRSRLMPINRTFNVQTLVEACAAYVQKTKRFITFEFILLAGVNDDEAEARRLATIARKVESKVNLIPYNPVPGLPYRRPEPESVTRFQKALEAGGVFTRIRETRGADIDAACGQLRAAQEEPLRAIG